MSEHSEQATDGDPMDGVCRHGVALRANCTKCWRDTIERIRTLEAENTALTERLRVAREALRKFGSHYYSCPAKGTRSLDDCNCPFGAALRPEGHEPGVIRNEIAGESSQRHRMCSDNICDECDGVGTNNTSGCPCPCHRGWRPEGVGTQ